MLELVVRALDASQIPSIRLQLFDDLLAVHGGYCNHRLRQVVRNRCCKPWAARPTAKHGVKKGLFPWTASGRAIANGRDEGVTKLLFDDSPEAHGHGKILGGGMVGTHAGDMIGEIALAIEMGADAVDIGKTIHPHPTLGESIGMAAEVAHGSCTDLPPAKK